MFFDDYLSNTFGISNENIKDMCNIIHNYGGLVYMDGAAYECP